MKLKKLIKEELKKALNENSSYEFDKKYVLKTSDGNHYLTLSPGETGRGKYAALTKNKKDAIEFNSKIEAIDFLIRYNIQKILDTTFKAEEVLNENSSYEYRRGEVSNEGFEEKMKDFFGNNFQNLSLKDIQKKFSSYQVSEGAMGDEDLVYSKGKEPKSYDKENLIDRAVKFIHNTVGINLYGLLGLPGAIGLVNVVDWDQLDQLGQAGNPMAISWIISAIASMLISWATKKYFRLK